MTLPSSRRMPCLRARLSGEPAIVLSMWLALGAWATEHPSRACEERVLLGGCPAECDPCRAGRFSPYTSPCTHVATLHATTRGRCPLLRTCDGVRRAPRPCCGRGQVRGRGCHRVPP